MSDKENLVYNEVQNPTYKALLDHVKVESAHSRSVNDAFGYCISMIALRQTDPISSLDEDFVKSKLEETKILFEKGDLRPLFDSELLEATFLAYKVLADYKKNNSRYRSLMASILQTLSNRAWLDTIDLASYACFACHDDKTLKDGVEAAAIWLGEKMEQSWERKLYASYVSSLFGISFIESAPLNWVTIFDESRINDLSESTLLTGRDWARLGISLLKMSGRVEIREQYVGDMITKADTSVRKELAGDSVFLEQGLREALSLVNSGMELSEANNAIKQVAKNWGSIEISGDGKVTLSEAPSTLSLPTLDVERHSLLLILLALGRHDKVFLLDSKNIQKAKEGANVLTKGYTAVSRPILTIVKVSSSILFFFVAIILASSIAGISLSDLNLGVLLAAGEASRLLSLPLPILVSVYLSITWFRFLDTAFSFGRIPKARLVNLFPLVDTVYGMVKGESA